MATEEPLNKVSANPVADMCEHADKCHLADGRSAWPASPTSGCWFPTLGPCCNRLRGSPPGVVTRSGLEMHQLPGIGFPHFKSL